MFSGLVATMYLLYMGTVLQSMHGVLVGARETIAAGLRLCMLSVHTPRARSYASHGMLVRS